MINKISAYNNNLIQFKGQETPSTLNKKQKAIIMASSLAGTVPILATLAYRKGFSLNPSRILKTPIKDWAIFKYKPTSKSIEFEEPQIIATATGSVVGGYIGGSIVDDKSNQRAKKREVLNQLLGNVLTPVCCVGLGSRFYSKYAYRLKNAMPQIEAVSKHKFINNITKGINIALKNFPNAVGTLTFLTAGIFLGNRVSNFINTKLYHKKVDRGIKTSDFAPHVDDLCMSISMMNRDSSFGSKLGRVIPLALIVPGYETGTAQEK